MAIEWDKKNHESQLSVQFKIIYSHQALHMTIAHHLSALESILISDSITTFMYLHICKYTERGKNQHVKRL